MFASFMPLTKVKDGAIKAGLTVSAFKKTDIETSNRGSKTLYVNNLSLAGYIELNGGQVERYEEALEEAVLKAKVKAVSEKAKLINTNNNNKLSEDMSKLYTKTKAENKQSIIRIVNYILQSLECASDTEYKELIKKPIGSVVDIQLLRDINDMEKPAIITFEGGYTTTDILIWNEIIKQYNKSQNIKKKLIKDFSFTETALEKYYEEDSDMGAVVNDSGQLYDFRGWDYEKYAEFFKNHNSIKKDYETKINYPLEDSVIEEIETKYRKKFHIDLLDKGGK